MNIAGADFEYGHDLPSVERLQRKHDGFERDLDAFYKFANTLIAINYY